MKLVCTTMLLVAMLVLTPAGATAQARDAESVAPLLWQPSMNVFRRFAVDRAKMIEFYGDVLGLAALPPIGLGGGNEMPASSLAPRRSS